MDSKTWRASRYEFYKILDNLMNRRIKYILDNKSVLGNEENINKAMNIAWELEREICTPCSALSLRMDDDEIEKILKLKCKLVEFDVEYWSKDSLMPNNLKELMVKCIADQMFGTQINCISFSCNCPLLNSDAVKDMVFIYSGLFEFELWDDEHVDAVIDHIIKYGNNSEYIQNDEIVKVFGKANLYKVLDDKISNIKYKDRLDWRALRSNPSVSYNDIVKMSKNMIPYVE